MPTTWGPSPIWGAGFMNVLGCNSDASILLAGGDVYGTFWSDDKGDRWQPGQKGYYKTPMREVAALKFSVLNDSHVYAANGFGLLKSTDGGKSWALKSSTLKFDAGNTGNPDVPSKHPRPSGHLLEMATVAGTTYMWAATFETGVHRARGPVTATGGDTIWDPIGPTPPTGVKYYGRSIRFDPSTGKLYVALYHANATHSGVWVCDNPTAASPTWNKMTGANAPPYPEEMKIIAGQLYVVGSSASSTDRHGVNTIACSQPHTGGWTRRNAGLDTSTGPPHLSGAATNPSVGPYWMSIDGGLNGSAHELWIGCSDSATAGGSLFKNIMRSLDGGVTWTAITVDAAAVSPLVAGTIKTATIANKALTGNVATLTTTAAHGFTAGQQVTVTGVDTTFNGTYTITAVPTATTFTYAKTAANVTSAASGGSATAGTRWWHYDSEMASMIHRGNCDIAFLLIDPSTYPAGPVRLWACGRAGAWRTLDARAASPQWNPAVNELQATIGTTVMADPNDERRIYVTNTDWRSFMSRDGWQTIEHVIFEGTTGTSNANKVPGSKGLDVAFDMSTTPSRVFFSSSNRDNDTEGEVYSKGPDETRWTVNEGLGPLTGGKPPIGIMVGKDSPAAGGGRVVLAAVGAVHGALAPSVAGIWRQTGASWVRVSSAAFQEDQGRGKWANFAWWWGRSTVFVFDRSSGIWRSTDYGVNWTNIWPTARGGQTVGFIDVDPTDARILWVSKADGVYKLMNADTGTAVGNGITSTRQAEIANPGALRTSRNGIVAACHFPLTATDHSKVWKLPSSGGTWEDTTDPFYEAIGWQPTGIDIDGSGNVVVLSWGTGGAKGTNVTTDTTAPTVPGTPVAVLNTSGAAPAVGVSWNPSEDPESGIKGYDPQRRINGGAWVTLPRVLGGATSFTDTNVSPNTSYDYRIIAVNAANPELLSAASGVSNAVLVPGPVPVSAGGTVANLYLGRMRIGGLRRRPTEGEPEPEPPPAPALKPLLSGLVDRQGRPTNSEWGPVGSGNPSPRSLIKSRVLKINWADIETADNVFSWTAIDTFLDTCTTDGARMRLRAYAGAYAPAHVKTAVGSMTWWDAQGSINGVAQHSYTVPVWWKDGYHDFWLRFLTAVAARYDNDDRMADMVCSAAGVIFAEPMLRDKSARWPDSNTKVNENTAAAQTPAYTFYGPGGSTNPSATSDVGSLRRFLDDHKLAFKRTRCYLAHNRYQNLEPNSAVVDGPAEAMGDYGETIMGAQLVRGQNSIQDPQQPDYGPLLTHLAANPPVSYQTQPQADIGNLTTVGNWAINTGRARAVELPSGYHKRGTDPDTQTLSYTDAVAMDAALRNGPTS